MTIKIIRKPKSQIKRETGFGACCTRKYRRWELLIPYKAKPLTILHEIGHAKLHHYPYTHNDATLRNIFIDELSAYLYALKKLGKPLLDGLFTRICLHSWEYFKEFHGITVSYAFNLFVNTAHLAGLELEQASRSYLWSELKAYHKKIRETN